MAEGNGLLGFLSTPEGQGLLAAGFGGLAGARRGQPLNSIGRGGLAGLAGYANAQEQQTQEAQRVEMNKDRDQNRALRQMQMDLQTSQLAKQKGQEQWQANLPAVYKQATEPTYGAGDEGPTKTAPNPQLLNDYLLQPNSPFADKVLENRLFPKASDYKVVNGTLVKIGTDAVTPVYTAPEKPEAAPSSVKEYEYARGQGYKGTFEQFQLAQRKAGATSVSVGTDNLGLKPKDRFEMEDKLRADYEKSTTNDAEIITTAADISNILKQNGALKDQAAIYKFAKALDPAGAVREADYAAIVKTAGGLDYVTSLVNKAITGEQLSPKQRQEMTMVSNAMADVARTRVSKQQASYSGRAKMYNLKPENVFTPSAGVVDFNSLKD